VPRTNRGITALVIASREAKQSGNIMEESCRYSLEIFTFAGIIFNIS
jgi:hypothetical protein